MTLAYWFVALAAFIPLFLVGAAKIGVKQFDNSRPRECMSNAEGWAQRANWAQQNGYEAFPPFAAGVIIAHLAGTAQPVIDLLAGLFLIARIAHGFFYIADWPNLRSIIWTFGFLCVVGLYLSPAWSGLSR